MAANIQALLAQMRQPDRGGGLTRPSMPMIAPSQNQGLPRSVAQGRLPMRKTGRPSPQRAMRGGARGGTIGGAMGAAAQPSGPRQPRQMPPQMRPPMVGEQMPPNMAQPQAPRPQQPPQQPQVPQQAMEAVGMAGEETGREDAQVNFLAQVIEAMMKAGNKQGTDIANIFGMLGNRRVTMRDSKKKKKK